MIKLNCDIGERGPDHSIDIELMSYIQIANVACGGHAGDETSVKAFVELAEKNDVQIAAHLSYPDKKDFGRKSLNITFAELAKSLDEQMLLLPGVKAIKFHGALYNDAVVNSDLTSSLSERLVQNAIEQIITFPEGELAKASQKAGILVINEVFAERRYAYDLKTKTLTLSSRAKPYASINSVKEAVRHTKDMIELGYVNAITGEENGGLVRQKVPIKADTVCIHSDSTIALELVKALTEIV